MNPESPPVPPASGCGASPQSAQERPRPGVASAETARSESTAPDTEQASSDLRSLITAHCSLGTSSHPPIHSYHPSIDDDQKGYELARLEETYAEPDFDDNEDARERELMFEDHATYNDDFSRSNDEGWFYSDEN